MLKIELGVSIELPWQNTSSFSQGHTVMSSGKKTLIGNWVEEVSKEVMKKCSL